MASWAQNLIGGVCLSVARLLNQSGCVACVLQTSWENVGSRAVYYGAPESLIQQMYARCHPSLSEQERQMSVLLILILSWGRASGKIVKRWYLECFVQVTGKAAQSHV